MTARVLVCESCGERRRGRLVEGGAAPERERCPRCGSTAYRDLLE